MKKYISVILVFLLGFSPHLFAGPLEDTHEAERIIREHCNGQINEMARVFQESRDSEYQKLEGEYNRQVEILNGMELENRATYLDNPEFQNNIKAIYDNSRLEVYNLYVKERQDLDAAMANELKLVKEKEEEYKKLRDKKISEAWAAFEAYKDSKKMPWRKPFKVVEKVFQKTVKEIKNGVLDSLEYSFKGIGNVMKEAGKIVHKSIEESQNAIRDSRNYIGKRSGLDRLVRESNKVLKNIARASKESCKLPEFGVPYMDYRSYSPCVEVYEAYSSALEDLDIKDTWSLDVYSFYFV